MGNRRKKRENDNSGVYDATTIIGTVTDHLNASVNEWIIPKGNFVAEQMQR